MVGSAQGWHQVPYLDTAVALPALAENLFEVPDGPPGVDVRIVPGYHWRNDDGAVDVMRGEETQLLGAVALGHRDGRFVLPGTHSKWVVMADARVERFSTYMTGERRLGTARRRGPGPTLRNTDSPFSASTEEREPACPLSRLRERVGVRVRAGSRVDPPPVTQPRR